MSPPWTQADTRLLLHALHLSNAHWPSLLTLLPHHPPSVIHARLARLHPSPSPRCSPPALAAALLKVRGGHPHSHPARPPTLIRRSRVIVRVTPASPAANAAVRAASHNPCVEVKLRGGRPLFDVVKHLYAKWGLPFRLLDARGKPLTDVTAPVYQLSRCTDSHPVAELSFRLLSVSLDPDMSTKAPTVAVAAESEPFGSFLVSSPPHHVTSSALGKRVFAPLPPPPPLPPLKSCKPRLATSPVPPSFNSPPSLERSGSLPHPPLEDAQLDSAPGASSLTPRPKKRARVSTSLFDHPHAPDSLFGSPARGRDVPALPALTVSLNGYDAAPDTPCGWRSPSRRADGHVTSITTSADACDFLTGVEDPALLPRTQQLPPLLPLPALDCPPESPLPTGEKAVMKRLRGHLQRLDEGDELAEAFAAAPRPAPACVQTETSGVEGGSILGAFLKSSSAHDVSLLSHLPGPLAWAGGADDNSKSGATRVASQRSAALDDNASDGLSFWESPVRGRDSPAMIRLGASRSFGIEASPRIGGGRWAEEGGSGFSLSGLLGISVED